MKLYLVRHTQVAVAPGICYGRSDVELASSFQSEAAETIAKLPTTLAHIFSSPLTRCVRLAHLLTPEPTIDGRLQEYNFGDWEMKSWDVLSKSAETQPWFADYINTPSPNGESYVQMAKRVNQFWLDCIMPEKSNDQSVALITHAGVIRALLANLLEIPLANAFNLTIDKGSVTQLTVGAHHVQVEYINR